ncbi:hypothetical protein ACQX80_14565, partial [Staphylococcus aureus]|uniref:hypothetical protein n=1 Tax=Staphylococcus aureus TaxID=1280 RepID=UPI003D22E34F
ALKSVMANYADLISDGTKMIGGEFKIASLERVLERSSGSVSAVRVCLDISEVELKRPGKGTHHADEGGGETFYFVHEGSTLKIAEITSKWVASC